jgi:hypothetical protein
MTFKTTLRLLVGVCFLGGALLLVDQQKRVRQASRIESQRVFDLATEPVTGIVITRENQTIECVKKGDDWFLKTPVRGRGNAAAVERIVALLETMDWDERITTEQRKARELTLADYGLAAPRVTIAVDTAGRREKLFLGDAVPLGSGIYARRGGSDAVLTVPVDVDAALPTSVEVLRDRAVFRGAPESTVRLELQRSEAGFIQLVRKETGWMFQQPLSAYADSVEVQRLLEALYALRVESFFWDVQPDTDSPVVAEGNLEMAAAARTESCGLAADAAQIRVTVWVEGDSLGQELLLGKPDPDHDGEVFAKRGEIDAIYTVKDTVLDVCSAEVNALRDRRLFPEGVSQVGHVMLQAGETKLVMARDPEDESTWRIVEPVQWIADTPGIRELLGRAEVLSIQTYLDSPVDDLGTLGLAPPQYAIALQPDVTDSEASTTGDALVADETLLIGSLSEDGKTRYAKIAGQDELFTIPAAELSWLNAASVAPLRYRDRTMLALTPERVRKLMVSTSAGEQGVERDSGGEWRCVGTGQMVPAAEALRQVLFVAGAVRAVRIEAHNPKTLEPYGLDAPAITVTFGLGGEEGIQKSLLIGNADGAGGVHAMVRGQDVVFLIPETLTELFKRPLCVAPSTPATAGSVTPPASDEVE